MPKVKDICKVIEDFAPRSLQESYDNAGLQVVDPEMDVSAALLCLDVTEDIMKEAKKRQCNMIVTHHPLLFKGLKEVTGRTSTERIVIDRVLEPREGKPEAGLGVVGDITPTPKLEFLRRVKETFSVRALRYSAQSPQIVIRRVAVCGGAGASLIGEAIKAGADVYVTGDVKYHDFTAHGLEILIADIGHYESELCSTKIFSRIIRERYPDFVTYFSESESNPVKYL